MSEQVSDAERIDSDVTETTGLTSVVDFFVGK